MAFPQFPWHTVRLLIIGSSVLILALCVWSSYEARKKTSNRIVDWLPQKTEELKIFNERYLRHFPEDSYLMISWKDCTLGDKRLDTIAEKLITPLDDGNPAYFARAMTPESVMDNLIDPSQTGIAQMSEAAAKSRLEGWLIGENKQNACLITVLSAHGRAHAADAAEFLFATIESVTAQPRADIYVAGPSFDSVAIDEISKKSQRTLLPFFLLFSLFLLLCCLRNFFAAMLVFWVAIINEELAGTLLYWCGAHVDSISMLNSSLVYVLTISGSVHLINYYRKTLAEMKPGEEKNAPMETFYKAIRPCSLATITTIMGMGSLGISAMIPIKTFGIYASLTLFLGTIWFFICILSVLQERPIRRWLNAHQPSRDPVGGHMPPALAREEIVFWERFGSVVFRWRMTITVLTFILLFFFSFGIKDLRTSVTFHGLLPKETKVLQDYRTLENKIGGLIPIEVVVHFSDENRKMLDQLHFMESLVEELRQTENVDTVISALNFIPNLPAQTSGGPRVVSRRAAMEGMLSRNQERLRDLRFFNAVENGGAESGYYWRISLRVPTRDRVNNERVNYAKLIAEVTQRLESMRVRDDVTDVAKNVRFDVTGGIPLVFRAQELLLWDLIYSFMTAFGLIALTMMIILRGIVRGLLAMIPNVFPCVIVFGTLGLCGIPVDMGSMMTASVALGISVDCTLHLLTWVNIGLRRGLERKDAVLFALHRCSTALFQTTIICGVGMLVFGLSDFVPVSRFAVLLCIILMTSLIGAVVALPAILFSPLGQFFESKDKERAWIL